MASDTLSACLVQIKSNPGRYYVYILSRPDGVPFYVGCGRVRGAGIQRIAFHEREAGGQGRSHKLSVIRRLTQSGQAILYSIDGWFDSPDEMFQREIALIAAIGRSDLRLGPLTNQNDGGLGQINPGEAFREKHRNFHKRNPDHAKRMGRLSALKRAQLAIEDPEFQEKRREVGRRMAPSIPKDAIRRGRLKHKRRIDTDPEYAERMREVARRTGKQNIRKLTEWRASLSDEESKRLIDKQNEGRRRGGFTERHKQWMRARNEERRAIISRCKFLIERRPGLSIRLPDGRAGLQAWKDFEQELLGTRGAVV